ncbi:MAG: hypothetical protein RLY58_1337 [Pseudomonadota bacterium]|jgi:uncharacterized protein YqeY
MTDLKTRLSDSVKTAMRERQMERLTVLRGVQAAIKQIEVDTRESLDDAQVLAVIEKQLKQRRESITAYVTANRTDLAEKEQFEATIISEFLPVALTDDELNTMIDAEISTQGATSIRDMGKVMNALRPQIMGKADAAVVSQRIKARLSA